jgi:hypothetical protein
MNLSILTTMFPTFKIRLVRSLMVLLKLFNNRIKIMLSQRNKKNNRINYWEMMRLVKKTYNRLNVHIVMR